MIKQCNNEMHQVLLLLHLLLMPQMLQQKVWQALRKIPYGHTVCYAEIAERVGCPKGMRAVGLANNRNPLPIFIPCHRVIGKDGRLVGYGGGLPAKEYLLSLEKARSMKENQRESSVPQNQDCMHPGPQY